MSAVVIALPVTGREVPSSRVRRTTARLADRWFAVVDRTPVVLIRRSELLRRQRFAFELGRDTVPR